MTGNDAEADDTNSDTVRFKFSLPEHQLVKFKQLAQRYNGGNLSGLIRQAVEFYTSMLVDGHDATILESIQGDVKSVETKISELETEIEELTTRRNSSTQSHEPTVEDVVAPVDEEANKHDSDTRARSREVQDVLAQSNADSVPISEIIKNCSGSPKQVVEALEHLVEIGVVCKESDEIGQLRYRLTNENAFQPQL